MLLGRPRHELKFLIPLEQKSELLEKIKFALNSDPHAGETGSYRVSSLYYDTSDLQAMYEKLDGVRRRCKYRLRYYGLAEDAPEPAFMEIKHRFVNMISKERVRLTPASAEKLLTLTEPIQNLPDLVKNPNDPMVGRVVRAGLQRPLLPAVIVTYVREAWVGIEESDLRVTFDHQLESFGPADYKAPGRSPGRSFLAQNQCVMEIKFDHTLPRWLRQRLVQRGLRPVRYSKYLEACLIRDMVAGVAT